MIGRIHRHWSTARSVALAILLLVQSMMAMLPLPDAAMAMADSATTAAQDFFRRDLVAGIDMTARRGQPAPTGADGRHHAARSHDAARRRPALAADTPRHPVVATTDPGLTPDA